MRLDHPCSAVLDPALPTLRLKKRADFLRAATGRKSRSELFTVQSVERSPASGDQARVGFTVTKKVGGAVERNRIRRRLREVIRLNPDLSMKPTHDYVIVARTSVLQARHEALAEGLRSAIRKLNR